MCPEGADRIVDLDEALQLPMRYGIVASPAPFHTSAAAAFLNANVPVLIEKPLSADSRDAAAFCATVLSSQPPVARVAYCLRFLSTAEMVRDILVSGRLGELLNVYSFVGQHLSGWRENTDHRASVSANKALGGGALLELSHELDLLNWFIEGLDVAHSWLRDRTLLDLEVEECADLVLTTSSGCRVDLHMDFWQQETRRRMEFFGTRGRVLWDLISNTIEIALHGAELQVLTGTEEDRSEIYVLMLLAFEAEIAGDDNPLVARLASVEQAELILRQIDKAREINAWRAVS